MVPLDVIMTGRNVPLIELFWTSFQTRSMPVKEHNPNIYSYVPKKVSPFTSLISKTGETADYTAYLSEQFPLNIYLFHDADSGRAFPQKGQLNSAVETYATLIEFS